MATEDTAREWGGRNWRDILLVAAIVLAVGSLIFNFILISTINNVTSNARQQILNRVNQLEQGEFTYNFPFNQPVPISITVPISQTFNLPLDFDFPIKLDNNLSLPNPLGGSIDLPLKIDTTIPFHQQFSLPIRTNLALSTTVAISATVPITVRGGDFKAVLEEFKQVLKLAYRPLT